MAFSLSSLYTKAWAELKKVGTEVKTFVDKEQPVVIAVGTELAAAATVISPAAGAAITAFDSLEELVVGKITSLASDASNATTLSALLGDAWPVVQSLTATLKTSPTVVAGLAKSV